MARAGPALGSPIWLPRPPTSRAADGRPSDALPRIPAGCGGGVSPAAPATGKIQARYLAIAADARPALPCYLSSQTSSRRAASKMLLVLTIEPLTFRPVHVPR